MPELISQQPRPENHGSRTITVNTAADTTEASTAGSASDSREGTPSSVGVLRLRGGPVRRNHVAWSSETVDNEGMGKKKSKICCIYHKPRKFDESSSESDDSSEDEHGSCCDETGGHSGGQRLRGTGSSHAEAEADSESSSDGGAGDGRARPRRSQKPRRHEHKHQPKPRMNKYDVQPTNPVPDGHA